MSMFAAPEPTSLEMRVAQIEEALAAARHDNQAAVATLQTLIDGLAAVRAAGDETARELVRYESSGRQIADQANNDLTGDIAVRLEQGDRLNRDQLNLATLTGESNASRAELAAAAALVGSPIYPSVEAGLSAVADDDTFAVEGRAFDPELSLVTFARVYRKVDGVAVPIGEFPSAHLPIATAAKLDAAISQATGARPALSPSQRWLNGLGFVIGERYAEILDPRPIIDARRRIVNRLGFVSAEEAIDGRQRIIGGWTRPIHDAQYRLVNRLGFVSQVIDVDGTARLGGTISRPITWARYVRSNPLGFLTFVEDLTGQSLTSGAEYSASAALPIATDSRSLSLWRAKLATLMQAGSVKARLLITGDSWTEKRPIPQQLANLLRAEYGDAGGGWIACSAYKTSAGEDLGPIDSATLAVTGWTLFDITASQTLPDCGCGHDGQALYTTGSAATATATFVGTEVSLFRPKSTGSLRYRIDGGAWTTLTGDGSNALEVTTIGALSIGTHTLSIDTSVNTGGGIAALFGIRYATAGATGVEILKCGNSGQDATQLGVYVASQVTAPIAALQPDVIVFILGTNDYRRAGRSPDNFTTVLGDYVTAARAGAPRVGFLFIAPADSDGIAVEPLTAYRDALAAFSIANGHDFYNMHDDWADWSTEDARGQWLDSLHVNSVGGYRLASSLIRHFLKI